MVASRNGKALRAFPFLGLLGTTWSRPTHRTRFMRMAGFDVTESPDRCGTQPRKRIQRLGGCRSTKSEAPDAVAPGSRNGKQSLSVGLAFLRPSTVHQEAVLEEYMRICKCGGIVAQSELTRERERWSCNSCGRYEILEKPAKPEMETGQLFEDPPKPERHPL